MPKSYRSSIRKSGFRTRKKLFVIATEGTETEPLYFEQFIGARDKSIRIKILPPIKYKSDPRSVMMRLIQFHKDHDLDDNDELWLIIDRDKWDHNLLDQIFSECKKKNYHLAVSNPCFEFWLYLHFCNPKPFYTAADCIKTLAKIMGGYSKSNYDLEMIMLGLDKAIERSYSHDDINESWPKNCGTKVHLIVEKLL